MQENQCENFHFYSINRNSFNTENKTYNDENLFPDLKYPHLYQNLIWSARFPILREILREMLLESNENKDEKGIGNTIENLEDRREDLQIIQGGVIETVQYLMNKNMQLGIISNKMLIVTIFGHKHLYQFLLIIFNIFDNKRKLKNDS